MTYHYYAGWVIKTILITFVLFFLCSCSKSQKVVVPAHNPKSVKVDISDILEAEKTETENALYDTYEQIAEVLNKCRSYRSNFSGIGVPTLCLDTVTKGIKENCEMIEIVNEKHLKGENYKTVYKKLKKDLLVEDNFIKLFKDSIEKNFSTVFQGYVYNKYNTQFLNQVFLFSDYDLPTWRSKLYCTHVSFDMDCLQDKTIFKYKYFYHPTRYGEKYPMGEDVIIISYKHNNILLSYDENFKNSYKIDLDGLVSYLKYLAVEPISYDNAYLKVLQEHLNKSNEIIRRIDLLQSELKEKADLLAVEDDNLFCILLSKDMHFWYDLNSRLNKVFSEKYKGKNYLNFSIIYWLTINNVNAKLNDQYKISRHLFDQIIRKAIRKFPSLLSNSKIFGFKFTIIAADENFVSKQESDFKFSSYEFYLPSKEIAKYINDDITGQTLAEHSIILVDKERIELR